VRHLVFHRSDTGNPACRGVSGVRLLSLIATGPRSLPHTYTCTTPRHRHPTHGAAPRHSGQLLWDHSRFDHTK